MFEMRKYIFSFFVFVSLISSAATEARWIWYPGDYGIWWGNKIQSQRLLWGAHLTTLWPMYEPYTRVLFKKSVDIKTDEKLEIKSDGNLALFWIDSKGRRHESAVLLGRFVLPAGAKKIMLTVQNSSRPPSVWVKGENLVSDSSWSVTWTTLADSSHDVKCESSSRFTDPQTPPGLVKLPTERRKPVWQGKIDGLGDCLLAADFGEETYGFLRLRDVKGKGAVKIIYAESEAEMKALDLTNNEPDALDGWEMVELSEMKEYVHGFSRGFRYISVFRASGDVAIGGIEMDRQTKGMPVRGSFRCNDEEVNRIWDVSVHTLDLTCREVFIEGIKRDHWVWSGDAVQSFLMNYYVFGDYDGCRDTLWTLRGKDPVVTHLNMIMDYTFYWFDAVEKYLLYSGDELFVSQVYPRMKSLLEFALGRLDENDRPVNRPGDWIFIDWAPKTLPNRGGVTSFEQMMLVRALEATANMADRMGLQGDAEKYLKKAKRLRDEIIPRYWNNEKGALMHMIYNDGRIDPMLTRYPNIFGLFHGYFNEEQKDSVLKNVIKNDDVMKIQTPYMRFYELESLCVLGLQSDVMKEIKSYWGGMLKLGATSFWELYNPSDSGEAHYQMYGRQFGKSLCHAWGATATYLLGKYYLGVSPTSAGFQTYDVKPDLGGLNWMEGSVPTPSGTIHVTVRDSKVTVRSECDGVGTLYWKGKTLQIPSRATRSLDGR